MKGHYRHQRASPPPLIERKPVKETANNGGQTSVETCVCCVTKRQGKHLSIHTSWLMAGNCTSTSVCLLRKTNADVIGTSTDSREISQKQHSVQQTCVVWTESQICWFLNCFGQTKITIKTWFSAFSYRVKQSNRSQNSWSSVWLVWQSKNELIPRNKVQIPVSTCPAFTFLMSKPNAYFSFWTVSWTLVNSCVGRSTRRRQIQLKTEVSEAFQWEHADVKEVNLLLIMAV